MTHIKSIKEITKKIAKQITDQNFFGSYPSLSEEFMNAYDIIIDYKPSTDDKIITFYNKILFINSAETLKNMAETSVMIDVFELSHHIKDLYDEIIDEANDEDLIKGFVSFYEKYSADNNSYDQDILDYAYILTQSRLDSTELIDNNIENIKNKSVFSENFQIMSFLEKPKPNKSHNLMQHLISMHGLVPIGPSTSIEEIAKEVFIVNAKNIEELVEKSGYSCLLLNKIQKNNYEYTIWNLIDQNFIRKNNLEDDPKNGVNKISIARLETVRARNTNANEDMYDFSMKLFEANDRNSDVFIMDTHDGETYRVMKKYGTNASILSLTNEKQRIFIKRQYVDMMLDPKTSSPRRMEVLNKTMDNILQTKICPSPNLFPEEKIIWNNVNEKIARQIISYFREYTKNKSLDYKILKGAINDSELGVVIINSLLSFIKIREVESNEVMLTIEFELDNCLKSLRGKLLDFVKSKKNKMKDYDKEQMLGFMESDLPYVLRYVFNSQANIFNSIIQKSLILKHFMKK